MCCLPALSLIAVMFPPEERAQALGVWAATAGAGLSDEFYVLGGVLVHEVGWQAVFLVNVPVVLVVVPAGIKVLPESRRPGTPPLDLLGVALSIVALVGVVFALIEGADAGWTKPAVVASGVIGVVAGAAFVRVELRGRHPLFDVRVLARPAVAGGVVAILGIYIAFLGTIFLLPQYLQYVQGRSVVAAGLVLAPIGVGTAIGARYNARLFKALGARRTISGGLLALAASTALFLLLSRTTTVAVVMIGAGLIGLLITLVVAPATAVIMNDLGQEKAGDGGAVNQLARQVGGALGVAIIGTVFAGVYSNKIEENLGRLERAAARARHGVDRGGARRAPHRAATAQGRAGSESRRRLRPGGPDRLRHLRRRAATGGGRGRHCAAARCGLRPLSPASATL